MTTIAPPVMTWRFMSVHHMPSPLSGDRFRAAQRTPLGLHPTRKGDPILHDWLYKQIRHFPAQRRCNAMHIGGYFVANAAKHRSEEHTSELQSLTNLVCRLLLEKKKTT